MIANLVQSEFVVAFNWLFGAAIVLGLLTVVLLVIEMMERWRGIEDVKLV